MKKSLKLIGNTPMYQLENTNIYIKLEKYNLGGSIKDRTVLGMIQDGEKKGILNKDSVLIEATSGNTGIALALIGKLLNYKVIIVMPDSMSIERRQLVKAYGAQLVLTPGEKGMSGAIAYMKEELEKNENYVSLGQFENPSNPQIHYDTTAVEILNQVEHPDVFVACCGTGGSYSGIAKRLKEELDNVICVVGEPETSAVMSGKPGGKHMIQGIGAGFIPDTMDMSLVDEIMLIGNDEAISETINFVKETGIFVGISSGANIALAKKLANRYPDKKIVTLAPDGGEKYLSVLNFGDEQ